MIAWTGYIVPSELLLASRPQDAHEATPVPADPTLSLLRVWWTNSNLERDFESLPDVIHIGFAWETMSPDIAALLASFPPDEAVATGAVSKPATDVAAPVVDAPPVSVARALRAIGWR